MPDNEKLKYSYELDISSLASGTTKALNMLQQQVDALTGVTNKAKSAAASARVFQKAWLDASGKTSKAVERMRQQNEAAQKAADKYLASQNAKNTDTKYDPSKLQQQIEALTGVASKTKSAEASAKAFEKAWLKASDKVSGKSKQVEQVVTQTVQTSQAKMDIFQKATQKISQAFEGIKQPLQNAFSPILTQLTVFGLMVSPTLTKKLQTFAAKAATAFGRLPALLNSCAAAFRRTSTETGDAESHSSKFATILDKLKLAGSKTVKVFLTLSNALRTCGEGLSKVGSKLKDSTRQFTDLTGSARRAVRAIQLFSGVSLGKVLGDSVKQSIAYTENMNLFSVAMGDALDEGKAFVNTMQELYGMDPSSLVRHAGNFYQLAAAIDMPSKSASKMSLALTKATNDISSLYNIDIETVFENLSSGLQGMSRAVTKYGFDIRAVTLQTTAAELGLTQQVESMSEANRIGLRFITMMRQASNASGDFARTIETPANQLRILKEQLTQLGRAIGDFFVAPIRTCIQYVNGFIMALRTVLAFIAQTLNLLTDFTTEIDFNTGSADSAADAIGGIGDAASGTTKKLKSLLAPFDELNILQDQTSDSESSGVGGLGGDVLDPAIADAIDKMGLQFEDVRMKANDVRDSILEFFGFTVDVGQIIKWDPQQFEDNLINKFPQWTKTIQAAFDNWSSIVEAFKNVFSSLGDVFDEGKKKFTDFISKFINDDTVSEWIGNLSDNLNNFSAWIDQHSDGLSTLVAILLGLGTAIVALSIASPILSAVGTALSAVGKVVTTITKSISLFSKALTFLGGLSGTTLAIIAVVALLTAAIVAVIKSSEDLQKKVKEAWDNIKGIVLSFWNNFLKPLLDTIWKTFSDLWTNHLKPLVSEVVSLVLDLWNNVLAPLLKWFIDTFGPWIASVLGTVFEGFGKVFGAIIDVVTSFVKVLHGVLDFIVGVFTGNWSKAWEGIKSIFSGIFGMLGGIAKGAINLVITAINTLVAAIWPVIREIGNAVGSVAKAAGKLLGKNWGWTMPTAPAKIPYLAKGGVVTDPTLTMIGEAGRDEAVIPLDNSPQMREFAETIANAVNRNSTNPSGAPQPIHVHVYIGNEELDDYIEDAITQRDIKTNGGN